MTPALPLGIVKKTEPLTEEFLPPAFPGRDDQLALLADVLTPGPFKPKPQHLWVHGQPGSGKSSLVRKVLAQLEEQRVRTAIVNCWSAQTFYSVLETIFSELRTLVPETRDVAFKFDRLSRIARSHALVIVLDEADQMFLKERNASLYNLCRLERAGVMCLSQTREAYLQLDARVRSRLQPRFVEFSPYTVDQLMAVLQERAEASLHPDSWCQQDLETIASASGGDARVAIQTLRTAGYLAEKARSSQLRPEDIHEGLEKSSELRRVYVLKGLSEHHRLLYQLVKEAGEITSPDLWKKYQVAARSENLQFMARRTFTHYKQYLVSSRLLEERQARGRANVRVLRVVT